MSKASKLLDRILRGTSDGNVRFDDLCGVLRSLGFSERVRGSHHVFTRDGVPEILNIQPRDGQAKPYQVKQVREVIVARGLAGEPAEEPAADQSEPIEMSPEGMAVPFPPPGRVLPRAFEADPDPEVDTQ